jgi:4'-phosphopantetheinyl transferase
VTTATVDVWRADLHADDADVARLRTHLDPDELGRAARFHFEPDGSRFIVSRATLRQILAHYLGAEPARLRLGYATEGKPHLLDYQELQFNLSHAGNRLLIAVSRNRQVGIDVERVPSEAVVAELSGRVLSDPEHAALSLLPGLERCERFAEFWTRKEAYIKADGRGMALELTRMDVSSSQRRVLLQDPQSGEWAAASRWTLRSIAVDPGYAGAVAGEGEGWRLTSFDWPVTVSRLAL